MPLGAVIVSSPGGGPDSLAVASPSRAWLIGWRSAPPSSAALAEPLAVARTTDAGHTWHVGTLPCQGIFGGFLSAAGNDVAALCLGEASAGYEAMEVATSSDGGANWVERCDNGPPGLGRIVGACPGLGAGRHRRHAGQVLLMAIGYPLGGVEVSLDGGRTWRIGLRSAATFLALSYGTGTVWMLGLGPVNSGLMLAESSDGRKWHAVALPISN